MLIRGHTEQEDVIRTTLYEPRGKFRDRVEGTERMHSDTTLSRQLGSHSIHTWAGYKYWQNENAWPNAKSTHARGGSGQRPLFPDQTVARATSGEPE